MVEAGYRLGFAYSGDFPPMSCDLFKGQTTLSDIYIVNHTSSSLKSFKIYSYEVAAK